MQKLGAEGYRRVNHTDLSKMYACPLFSRDIAFDQEAVLALA